MMEFRPLSTTSSGDTTRGKTAMSFGGVWLDDVLDGYKTLNVAGRETIGYTLSTAGQLAGRDGTVIYSKSLESRTMTVTYELKADTPEEYQARFAMLGSALHSDGDVEIAFADDPFVYYGQVTAKAQTNPGVTTTVSTFTITCQNPFRYGSDYSYGPDARVVLGADAGEHRINPKLEVVVGSTTHTVTIRNQTTGKRIIFNDDFVAGDAVKIRIYPKPQATKNGVNLMPKLSFGSSDFGEFKVKAGDVIVAQPEGSTVTITGEGAWI